MLFPQWSILRVNRLPKPSWELLNEILPLGSQQLSWRERVELVTIIWPLDQTAWGDKDSLGASVT